jgi:2-polyprenyl-6-methoxyphenol hydroxylase-like FAD-dependent oxidoreductase
MLQHILIVGGGICGFCTALALSKELTPLVPNLQITIFERHEIPSTSGGAISLSPVAQRHLAHLGILQELDGLGQDSGAEVDAIEVFSVRTGKSLGSLDFTNHHGQGYGGYKGRRVLRINILLAMIAAVEKTPNIEIVFGKKLTSGIETDSKIQVYFEDGSRAMGDLLLGCDGVHSATRTQIIDPEQKSHYSGFSLVQATVRKEDIKSTVHFRSTALNISRNGSLLMSFYDQKREEIFLSAMVQCREEAVPDHRLDVYYGEDRSRRQTLINSSLRHEVTDRFGDSAVPCIREVAQMDIEWLLYPVYQISPGGRWCTSRAMLLGDAAHAVSCHQSSTYSFKWNDQLTKPPQMLPRDESAAYALDDAILFSRVLAQYINHPLESAFATYETLRRDTVNLAFKASRKLWDQYRDAGAVEGRFKEWLLPLYIRHGRDSREEAWEFDASRVEIPVPPVDNVGKRPFTR